jgi:hypothetical protein
MRGLSARRQTPRSGAASTFRKTQPEGGDETNGKESKEGGQEGQEGEEALTLHAFTFDWGRFGAPFFLPLRRGHCGGPPIQFSPSHTRTDRI